MSETLYIEHLATIYSSQLWTIQWQAMTLWYPTSLGHVFESQISHVIWIEYVLCARDKSRHQQVGMILIVLFDGVRGSSWGTSRLSSLLNIYWYIYTPYTLCTWCLSSDACLRCQTEGKQEECVGEIISEFTEQIPVQCSLSFSNVVVWGECNHSFHNCCMQLWIKQNNRCPLCQQEWVVQRFGS